MTSPQESMRVTIPGLNWEKNFYAETGSASYTLVANPGPLVSDFHFFRRGEMSDFVVHRGHTTRYTFLGDPAQEITATFVDCRRGSPSLHSSVTLEFTPDPRRVLNIPQGVAMRFTGLMNVTLRSEPIWFAPAKDNGYQVGNDQVRVAPGTPFDRFPVLSVNDLPLPGEVLQIILARQQQMLRDGAGYDVAYEVAVDGALHEVTSRQG